MIHTSFGSRLQRGVATLLILVLVGLATSAMVVGSLRVLQGGQKQVTVLHAQTLAQFNAWAGVDMFYQFLRQHVEDADVAGVEGLFEVLCGYVESGEAIPLSPGIRAQVATIHPFNSCITPTESAPLSRLVYVHLFSSAAEGTQAESSSVIEVVFDIGEAGAEDQSGGDGEVPYELISPLTFNRNLRLSGNITVQAPPGMSYEMNVNGTLVTGGNSINGVDTIRATDSINIGSGSSYRRLFSNGDVSISGSVQIAESIEAGGNVCLIGGSASPGETRANGFVYGSGSAAFGTIQALGDSTYLGSNSQCDSHARTDRHGDLFAIWMSGNNSVQEAKAGASVAHGSGTIQALQANGDLHITNGGSRVVSGTVAGEILRCNANNLVSCSGSIPGSVNVSSNPGLSVDIDPVEEITVELPGFDAYDVESIANYVFRIDPDGFRRVYVRNISGIPEGEYYIASYSSGPYKDRICSAVTPASQPNNPVCSAPINPDSSYPVCWGHSPWNTCFSYSAGTKTWTLNGTGLAQGIAWFEGNLSVGNGTYYNTFIATGDVQTNASHKTYAPNYAGYSGGSYAPKGICTNAMSPHYPTQLCNDDGSYNSAGSAGIGNFAFMAGSVVGDAYQGGNIQLGSSTDAYGSVLAGNEFNSGGNTRIRGAITALGSGAVTFNSMGGSTTIIIDDLPPTFTPIGQLPDLEGGGGSGSGTEDFMLRILWTRYL